MILVHVVVVKSTKNVVENKLILGRYDYHIYLSYMIKFT